jgi:hypothetical protein
LSLLPQGEAESGSTLPTGERQETHSLQSSGTSPAQAGASADLAAILAMLEKLPEEDRARLLKSLGSNG